MSSYILVSTLHIMYLYSNYIYDTCTYYTYDKYIYITTNSCAFLCHLEWEFLVWTHDMCLVETALIRLTIESCTLQTIQQCKHSQCSNPNACLSRCFATIQHPFRGRMISQWLTVHKSEPSPSRWLGPCVSFHGPPIAEDANPLAIHGLYSATWAENILGTIARVFSQWYQHVAFESMGIIFPNRKPLRLLEGICTGQTSKVYIHTTSV